MPGYDLSPRADAGELEPAELTYPDAEAPYPETIPEDGMATGFNEKG